MPVQLHALKSWCECPSYELAKAVYIHKGFLVAFAETKRELVLSMAFFDQSPLPSNLEGQVNVLYMERPPLLDSLVFSASFLRKLLFVPYLSMATEKPTVHITPTEEPSNLGVAFLVHSETNYISGEPKP